VSAAVERVAVGAACYTASCCACDWQFPDEGQAPMSAVYVRKQARDHAADGHVTQLIEVRVVEYRPCL
jgi:hypothetical protein